MANFADTQPGFVWMAFPGHGGTQQFPAEAVPMWRARGWQECDPPAVPNPLKDPILDEPEPEPEPQPAAVKAAKKTPDAGTDTKSPQGAEL